MVKKFSIFFLLYCCSIWGLKAQDRLQLADTLLIDGDTIIMLGDSIIFKQEVKPVYWEKGGNFNLSIQQVSLSNWNAGGSSNLAWNTALVLFGNYKKDKIIWDTKLNINVGFNRQAGRSYPSRKTNDNFIFITKYGRELTESWFLSTQLDARTQLLEGFRYFRPSGAELDSRSKLSDFLAPAYIQSSTGLNYRREFKNKDRISLIASPFTGRFTIVMDDSLSNAGAFGVVPGELVLPEAGLSFGSTTDIQLYENIRWRADLNLFTNFESLGNFVVNLNSVVSMRVNKFITTRIETILIYDEKVFIQQDSGPPKQAIQLQNMFNFGIGLDF
ncbi:DUF3078 domain-containing protein [Aquiflexum gelatinilyticum]|uniref:DUF3078 domain-containing protein n=1 Tax=Aquiflexum gelatinilyticum TaxID=2961943 RepID=A0A9X2T1U6_9BACT|nr:DUF3078 domain-containing protein [Aquiflexum gelatinilyticum]MCR9017148.1 DUF3078 domain-containing protein [Aquiflexum gelatinilyticum]